MTFQCFLCKSYTYLSVATTIGHYIITKSHTVTISTLHNNCKNNNNSNSKYKSTSDSNNKNGTIIVIINTSNNNSTSSGGTAATATITATILRWHEHWKHQQSQWLLQQLMTPTMAYQSVKCWCVYRFSIL